MRRLTLMLSAAGACVMGATALPTTATALETVEAKTEAGEAASHALLDMFQVWGFRSLKPGQYLWRNVPDDAGPERVVISLGDQLAYLYRGDTLVAVATISTGIEGRDTPTGIFAVRGKTPFHRSRKYDNAPMPFTQFIDQYGIAMHGGHNPGYPASHGCIRLPAAFAKRLYGVTEVGTPVYIGA